MQTAFPAKKELAGKIPCSVWEEQHSICGKNPVFPEQEAPGRYFFPAVLWAVFSARTGNFLMAVLEKRSAKNGWQRFFWNFRKKGQANINLVTGEHFDSRDPGWLTLAKEQGLTLPVVYNSSGYEKPETIRLLKGSVDIWLPDFKYWDVNWDFVFPEYRITGNGQ